MYLHVDMTQWHKFVLRFSTWHLLLLFHQTRLPQTQHNSLKLIVYHKTQVGLLGQPTWPTNMANLLASTLIGHHFNGEKDALWTNLSRDFFLKLWLKRNSRIFVNREPFRIFFELLIYLDVNASILKLYYYHSFGQ